MIRAGDMIENPVTGERILFRKTSHETNGEMVLVETWVQPGGTVAAAHVHPRQEERLIAGPSELVKIPAGTPHTFWNAGEDEAHFLCEIRPAQQFTELLETMFSLALDGKTNRKGMPNPLRLAVIANHHIDDVQLPIVPRWMQKSALALGAPIGRLLGYRPDYVVVGHAAPAAA